MICWIKNKLNHFHRVRHPLLVLMYHDLSEKNCDGLTLKVLDFVQQMNYLKNSGHHFLNLEELITLHNQKKELPPSSVLITFDDAYRESCSILRELQEQGLYFLKINMFLPVGLLGSTNQWDQGKKSIISSQEAFDFTSDKWSYNWSWGLHSFEHKNYQKMSEVEIKTDLKNCFDRLNQVGLKFTPTLAFPYGAYWRKSTKPFFNILKESQMQLAFRIGNRRNRWPLKNPLLIERIDIRGDQNFEVFLKKIRMI